MPIIQSITKGSDYHEQQDILNAMKLRMLLKTLPIFAHEFFRGLEITTSSRTRIAYAYDLNTFFNYLFNEHPKFIDKSVHDFQISDLDTLTAEDIEIYMEYLTYYLKIPLNTSKTTSMTTHTNKERGKSRKLATLRSFYRYFFKKQKIKTNPVILVDMPKLHEKNIVRLEIEEVAKLLDNVESGEGLTKHQHSFHEHTKNRDLALLTLLLGTGIRVSECVGLNCQDVDFNVNGIRIVRKGGTEVIIYFGVEVEQALKTYFMFRDVKIPLTGHEDALFLSLQNKRMSVRSIQNLVKKYAQLVTQLKTISPHKLRSTYGTSLYRETGDIYLVADVLGHKDVNTTKRHYAQIEDERRRSAAKAVKLREE